METPTVKTEDPAAAPPASSATLPPAAKRSGGAWLWIGLILALVVVAVLLLERSRQHSVLINETRAMAVPTVTVAYPLAGPTHTEVVLPGSLAAFSEAPIFARASGYVKAWYKDIGAHVEKGDVLADIYAPDIDAQLDQTRANLTQAKANLEIARLNYAREQDLLQRKVVSQQEFEQNRANFQAMEAAVQAGEANVQDMAAQKNFQQVVAPFPGIVTRRNTDVGALINAGAGTNMANNQELFHLARTDILRVNIQVPQVYSADVALDTPAYLVLEQFPGEKFMGKVAHVSGAIDPATRTLLVEVQVANQDGRLLPGAFAQVHLILPVKNPSSTIPINAVLFRSQGTQVGVVTPDNVVHLHSIVIGRDFGTSVEVVHGIGPRDRLILNPSDSLAEGAIVQPQEAPPASPAPH